MTIPARWVKVRKDILNNMARTILVVLSIAVGVFAIGMTTNAGRIIKRDMNEQYLATNPDSATFNISPFGEQLVRAVQGLREVDIAEARRVESADILLSDGTWEELTLNAISHYDNIQINQFAIETGSAPPGIREAFLERKTAEYLGLSIGDNISVRLPGSERSYALEVTGILHDMHTIPPELLLQTNAYVSMDTLQSMGAGRYYNTLLFTVEENRYDKEYNMKVAGKIRDRIIQPSGYRVARIVVEEMGLAAGQHWANRDISGLILILNFMGIMCIFLAVGLIINNISALMKQQIKQIGILRIVGGLRHQVFWMYIVNIFVLALCALGLAFPLGVLGAGALAKFAAQFINVNVTRIDVTMPILLLQIGVGLLVPLCAAMVPILSGTAITIYEAIYQHGNIRTLREGFIEILLKKIRGLTSPIILSVRNTFRNKSRLLLTLGTLILAGATFISAPSTHKSILTAFDVMVRYWDYDASLTLPGGMHLHTATREAKRATGASVAEGWYQTQATFTMDGGRESEAVEVMAIPPDTHTVEPNIVSGRWLKPDDADGIVVNEDLLDQMPQLRTGSEVILRLDDVERQFRIVGIASRHIFGARIYAPYGHITKIIGAQNITNLVRVRMDKDVLQAGAVQTRLAQRLEAHFDSIGMAVGSSDTQAEIVEGALGSSVIILMILLLMALLLATVGGLGLAGTMSLNVMERTREIGVLRAMGAANGAIRKIVLAEGLVVGLISWLVGTLLSYPLGSGLSDAVTLAIMQSKTEFQYSIEGAVIWLGLILVITVLASLIPAQRASQLTVREVLAYE
jgi:putative ABC transport system permease protein